MAAEQELPEQQPESWSDDPSEAQLEHWLHSAYDGPALRPEFSAALRQQLEQEFIGLQPRNPVHLDVSEAFAAASSRNGTVHTAPTSAASPSRKLRWILSLATAAAMLVGVSFWNSRPAYGWAEMLRALEQCAWVQAVVPSEAADQTPSSGWLSSKEGVLAVKSKGRTAFVRGQAISHFRADERVIYQRTLQQQAPWSWQSLLLALVAREFELPEQTVSDALLSAQIVKESWRRVPASNGQRELIELEVTLRLSDAEGRQLAMLFVIDPETHLPVSCRVAGSDAFEPTEYEFSYPNKGPETIFALGVPRETEVVTSLALASRPATRSPQVEPREVIEHLVEAKKSEPKAVPADAPAEQLLASNPIAVARDSFGEVAALPFDELVERINTELSTFWKEQALRPAAAAADEEFVRRAYLDLTGRIPMVSEVYQFLDDTLPNRRERLVEDLLNRRDHATHLAAVWRGMLLPDGVELGRLGGTAQFDGWLADRFGENVPYDQLVGQLLLAEGRVSESGPLLFYAALKLNPEEIAAKTSRAFLGMRMECAQCHDHPFDQVTQDAFWGYAAFFAQISRPQGRLEMVSPVMRVHDIPSGEVMLPDTDFVVKPRLPGTDADLPDPAAESSRRRQLVDWLTSTDNQRFSRATVNRVWEHLFGRGLVNPVDDMRADNPAICPELMDLLSKDFAASGFDLRRLLRALVLSDAYQLSSRADTDEPSQALCFARMNVKSLTADQLYDCIAVATRNEAMITSGAGESSLARFENPIRQAFIQQFRAPPGERTDYQAGIPQALALMHGALVDGATDLKTSGLLKSLEAPFFTDEQRVETLFLATLSRRPEPHEREQMLAHVQAAESPTDKVRALGDVLWALLNSAEFTFIH